MISIGYAKTAKEAILAASGSTEFIPLNEWHYLVYLESKKQSKESEEEFFNRTNVRDYNGMPKFDRTKILNQKRNGINAKTLAIIEDLSASEIEKLFSAITTLLQVSGCRPGWKNEEKRTKQKHDGISSLKEGAFDFIAENIVVLDFTGKAGSGFRRAFLIEKAIYDFLYGLRIGDDNQNIFKKTDSQKYCKFLKNSM